MVLLNKLLKSWFDEIFFGESKFIKFSHCVICTDFLDYPQLCILDVQQEKSGMPLASPSSSNTNNPQMKPTGMNPGGVPRMPSGPHNYPPNHQFRMAGSPAGPLAHLEKTTTNIGTPR